MASLQISASASESATNDDTEEPHGRKPAQADIDEDGVDTEMMPPDAKISYMSLPNKRQLALLCLARVADPLAASSIHAYMFYQLKWFSPSASAATISTQAGIILGAETAAHVCTGILWGRAADAESGGRKAVLTFGLLSSCIAYVGYGFSTTFASAVAWRVFSGVTNSNVAIVRCVVAELNPEKRYRTRALMLLPLSASTGMLIGPLVGGLLSSPTDIKGALLKSYPYAAPNIFIAAVYALAALGVILFLDETLPSLQHSEDNFARRLWNGLRQFRGDASAQTSRVEDAESSSTTPLLSRRPAMKRSESIPFRRIWTFNVVCTMLAQFIIAGHLGTFAALWAIFLSTPVGSVENESPPFRFNGGAGMQARDVGFAMSLLGVLGVVLQTAVYPMLNDRFGTVPTWRMALFVFPVVYALAPYVSLVASTSSSGSPAVWAATAFVTLLFVLGRTGVTPATTLLINDCTPHPLVRGTIHTAGTVISNLGRSIFPIGALAIFGYGLRIGVVGLGFWCLACLAVLACIASRWVQEGSNGGEIKL